MTDDALREAQDLLRAALDAPSWHKAHGIVEQAVAKIAAHRLSERERLLAELEVPTPEMIAAVKRYEDSIPRHCDNPTFSGRFRAAVRAFRSKANAG